MAESKRDDNRIETMIGASNSDGSTPVLVKVDASHNLLVSDGTTGSSLSGNNASRDNSGIPVLMGVSSADGITPIAIYADSATGKLLIKST